MKVIAAGATPAAATAAASSSSQGGDGGLELLLHHASSSSLVSTAGSEGEEISVADERDTAYRRRRALESQADEREKKEEQVEGEEEEEQKKMLKALQVYPATEKDDKLLHAANASRSPVPRWSRASARSSDDEGSQCGLSSIPNPPPPPPPPPPPLPTDDFLSGVACFQQPSNPMPETPPVQGFTSQELSCSDYSHKSSLGWRRQQQLLGDSYKFAEPEPSAVAAKLKKAALVAGQQEEQTLEELLSSMGVSLTLDQESLDFAYALEYHAPPPTIMYHDDGGTGVGTMTMADNDALIDSLPVSKPLGKTASCRGFKVHKPPLDIEMQRSSKASSSSIDSRLVLQHERKTSLSGMGMVFLSEPTDTMVVAEAVRSQEAASLTSPVASIPGSENSQESSISLPVSNIPAAAAAESSQDLATTPQHNEPQRELSSFTQLQQGQDTEHCSVLLPPDNSLEVEEEVRVDQSYVSSSEVVPPLLMKPEETTIMHYCSPSQPSEESMDIGEKTVLSLYVADIPDSPASTSSSAASVAFIDASKHSQKSSSSDIGEIPASTSFSASPSIASSLSGSLAALSYYVKGKGAAPMTENSSDLSNFLPEMLDSLVCSRKPYHSALSLMGQPAYDPPHDLVATCGWVSEPASGGGSGNIPALFPTQDRKKGGCYGCGKSRHLQDKEVCMVCSSKFCSSCMVKHMGSMPEGRKCVGCIGQPIHETRRPCVGKPSRLLKHMLGPLEVQQIMKAERECPANQFRPEQVWVNGSKLSKEEMALLLGCEKSPQKLKPGRFWYDSQTGLWGKEGHRPDNIISPLLKVGGNLQTNASNGTTKIFMNGRELGKLELKMLKLAGVHCPPNTHLWVENNGNYSEEGFNNIKGNIWGKEGNIWEKASIKLLYPFFSLPTPGSSSRGNSEKVNGAVSNRFSNYLDQSKVHKLLLLGHEGSGRSTIFKQAKILYNNGFTKEEKADFKSLIQANIFKYMSILLEARERFEEDEDDLAEIRAQSSQLSASSTSSSSIIDNLDLPSASAGVFTWNEKKERKSMSCRKGKSVFAIEPRLKQASDRFLEKMAAESLESRFPSSLYTQEFAQIVEELWNNPAIKAVYERRAELYSLPTVANYYLDRVVEVSKTEYEPTENDILQAEGLSQGSGLVQIEFDLDDKVSNSGPWQDCESPSAFGRYQLIRVGGKSCDRQKWLEMFEDIGVIIFCVALSDYDGLWPDSSGTLCNKMMQTRDLFESILKYPCFRDTPFVLLLNKNDVFEDKIFRGIPLTACEWFSDFSPIYTGNQAQQAYQYIAHRYKELFSSVNSRGRKLFTFQLNALEKTAVSLAFQYVQETLKFEEHRATGFGMLPEDSCYSTDVSSFSQHFLACQPETDRRDRKQY